MITTYKIVGAKRVALVILFVLMVASLPLISYHKITGRFEPERLEKDLPIYEVGKIADEILPKNALAIGCLMGGPEILYYSNRRGWTMGANVCSIERIENLRREGAQYFITTEQDNIDNNVINYLKSKYITIRSTNEYLIVQL
jgi:hypothetical protein